MNLLISNLGAKPEIIKETVGLFNYNDSTDFYKNKAANVTEMRRKLAPVDEVWLVATDQPHVEKNGKNFNSTRENFEEVLEKCAEYGAKIRIFVLKGVKDISSESDARNFHDLLLRVVYFAHQQLNGGKLYLSLACGRKTMSTDMQDAAYCFGCDMLLHILGENEEDAKPLLIGKTERNEALNSEKIVGFEDIPYCICEPETDFLDEIESKKRESQYFFTSYYLENVEGTRSNFHILYTLPPSKINQLKIEKLGCKKEDEEKELQWLKKLPKSDLHCHLGGALNVKEIVKIAVEGNEILQNYAKTNANFSSWLQSDRKKIFFDCLNNNWKESVKKLASELRVPKFCISAALLQQFNNREEELQKIWYKDFYKESDFQGIGIEKYEQLGDLQGSLLLDHPFGLESALNCLLSRCKAENVKYLEIRCSPLNYENCEMSAQNVVERICNILQKYHQDVETSLIFIISRHRDDNISKKYAALVNELKGKAWFMNYFRGFDLAGNESIKKPKEFRENFQDVMRDCLNITIHAGETEKDSENIWQAVYELNAERVGHGLHLLENEKLGEKFMEREIGVEICPSSNFQIVGYRDNFFPQETEKREIYPLKNYLNKELKVSVNTDDPGISLTDMTHELHKAARMTPDGLSKWEILQLLCNGFRTAFYPYKQKKNLIEKVEKNLGNLIKRGEL